MRLVSSQFQKHTLHYVLKTYHINLEKQCSIGHNKHQSPFHNIGNVALEGDALVSELSAPKKLYISGVELPKYLSPSITHLTFGRYFKPLDDIPNSVMHLTLDWDFDQPNSITHMYFGYHFDQCVVDNLPNSITYLKFGYQFNHQVYRLPNSITQLEFSDQFNHTSYSW